MLSCPIYTLQSDVIGQLKGFPLASLSSTAGNVKTVSSCISHSFLLSLEGLSPPVRFLSVHTRSTRCAPQLSLVLLESFDVLTRKFSYSKELSSACRYKQPLRTERVLSSQYAINICWNAFLNVICSLSLRELVTIPSCRVLQVEFETPGVSLVISERHCSPVPKCSKNFHQASILKTNEPLWELEVGLGVS